jgi:hypothetical protein
VDYSEYELVASIHNDWSKQAVGFCVGVCVCICSDNQLRGIVVWESILRLLSIMQATYWPAQGGVAVLQSHYSLYFLSSESMAEASATWLIGDKVLVGPLQHAYARYRSCACGVVG